MLEFVLGLVGDLVGNVLDLIRRYPWQALAIVLLMVAFVQHRQIGRATDRADREHVLALQWRSDFRSQREEMRKFVGLVRAARVAAARADQLNNERVTRETAARIEEVKSDYQDDLAVALDAVDRRLHDSIRQAGGGGAGSGRAAAQLPIISDMPEGALRPGEAAIISAADARLCIANTVRLEQLIRAWNGVAGVDVNGASEGPLQTP